jgi:MerR HTH family regulatory protein
LIVLAGREWVTAAEAAEELGVPAERIRDWTRRRLVEPARLPNRRVMYRLDDLWDVERDTRQHGPRGRPGQPPSNATANASTVSAAPMPAAAAAE